MVIGTVSVDTEVAIMRLKLPGLMFALAAAAGVFATFPLLGTAVAQPAKPDASPAKPEASIAKMVAPAPLGVSFDVDQTVVEVGRTHMLPFRTDRSAVVDTKVDTSTDKPEFLNVVRAGEVLEGFSLGFARVHALRVGQATLRIGSATQTIRIVPARSRLWQDLSMPRVVAPLPGACVWEGTKVGVSWLENPASPHASVRLRVQGPSSRDLQPIKVSELTQGPTRVAVFDLDLADLPRGEYTLTPVAVTNDQREVQGPSNTIRVVKPTGEQLMAIDAAELKDAERPERFTRGKVTTGLDNAAFAGKGGRVVLNNNTDPPVCYGVEIAEPGMYQMMLITAGDWALGAWPTVGLVVDGANQPVTSGQLVMAGWHRVPVGVPVRLEAGKRILSPRFENDASAGNLGDRNLRIQRIEVARVSDLIDDSAPRSRAAAPAAPDAGGDMMTMAPPPAPSAADSTKKPEPAGDSMMAGGKPFDPYVGQLDPADPQMEQDVDQTGIALRTLRIAWKTMFNGLPTAGVVELEAHAYWNAADRNPAPVVTLLINGKEAMSQRSAAPRFWIHEHNLKPGANILKLVALGHNGLVSESIPQTLIRPESTAAQGNSGDTRVMQRFTLHDPAWSQNFRDRVRLQGDARELRKAALPGGLEYELTLPQGLTGLHRAHIECRGATGKGLAKVTASVRAMGREVGSKTFQLRGQMSTLDLGEIDLPAGPKSVFLTYTHKGYEESSSEPGLYVESIILDPTTRAPAVPTASIVYPVAAEGASHQAFGSDAIIASVTAGTGILSAQAVVDDQPIEITEPVSRAPGLICVRVPLRDLSAGAHTLAVRVTDELGRVATSAPTKITIPSHQPTNATTYQRAVRMLSRLGLGPDTRSLTQILSQGEEAWLAAQLSPAASEASDAALALACARFVLHRQENDVAQRYLAERLVTPMPARSQMNAWVQNHFTTWLRKVETDRKWEEYQRLCGVGSASLHDLLLASATSPAMMLYLDQHNSYKGRLNENYAREIMELHTLGAKAGYVQADVTAMARLLTGWIAARQGESMAKNDKDVRSYDFRFDPRLNDDKPQTVFGVRFESAAPAARFDRALMAIEMLARHPKTAHYIAEELCERYVEAPAPSELVERIALDIQRTGGDLNHALLMILKSEPMNARWAPRLTSPSDFILRIARASESRNPAPLSSFLRRCKQGVFDCPTPDGYAPEDSAWADSNAMIQRLKFAREAAPALVLAALPDGIRTAKELTPKQDQLAVDLLAIRLTGMPLSGRSNEAVMNLVASVKGTTQERLREAAAIVAQMPEVNLR